MNDGSSTSGPYPHLARLLDIIARLRAPGGCPWDREQTEASMAPHLLEEAYEAVEALQQGTAESSCEELGDLLMNIAMVSRIAAEAGRYDIEDVARGIADKLVRRHPHVFGDVQAETAETVLQNWEAIKKSEKSGASPEAGRGTLDGVPVALPALLRAFRMGEKASRVGFDWPDAEGPRQKLAEELAELDQALATGAKEEIEHELGDLLFSAVNLARHAGINPEMALRSTCQRFQERFTKVERALGTRLREASLEEKEALWQAAKGETPPGA